jgi:hypothetical protein
MTSRELEYAKEDLELIREFYRKELVILCGSKRINVPAIMTGCVLWQIEKFLYDLITMEEMAAHVPRKEGL